MGENSMGKVQWDTGGRRIRYSGIHKVRAEQRRLAGTLLICALTVGSANANAQAGATPPTARGDLTRMAMLAPIADDVCRTLEQAAAENSLPLEFLVRVIWQESRFNARAISSKGAKGIAQFMRGTAHWHGLRNPFNPIEALRHSAGYYASDSAISVSLQRPTMPVQAGSAPGEHGDNFARGRAATAGFRSSCSPTNITGPITLTRAPNVAFRVSAFIRPDTPSKREMSSPG
jgi:hypothetical protein